MSLTTLVGHLHEPAKIARTTLGHFLHSHSQTCRKTPGEGCCIKNLASQHGTNMKKDRTFWRPRIPLCYTKVSGQKYHWTLLNLRKAASRDFFGLALCLCSLNPVWIKATGRVKNGSFLKMSVHRIATNLHHVGMLVLMPFPPGGFSEASRRLLFRNVGCGVEKAHNCRALYTRR